MKCRHFERRAAVKPNDRLEEMLTLWRDIAVVVAGAESTKEKTTPGKWANQCMEDYAEVIVVIQKARGGP